MKAEKLRQRLINAARRLPPADGVPYAFEKRVMARLGQIRALDPWRLWNRVLWRCAGPCVALTLLAGALTWWTQSDAPSAEMLAADIEMVVYAPLPTTPEIW